MVIEPLSRAAASLASEGEQRKPPRQSPTAATAEADAAVPAADAAQDRDADLALALERVTVINFVLAQCGRDVLLSVDESAGETVIWLRRPSTGEILRQMPPGEVRALAARLDAGESLSSVGIDQWT